MTDRERDTGRALMRFQGYQAASIGVVFAAVTLLVAGAERRLLAVGTVVAL